MTIWIDEFIQVDERHPSPIMAMAVGEIIMGLELTGTHWPRNDFDDALAHRGLQQFTNMMSAVVVVE